MVSLQRSGAVVLSLALAACGGAEPAPEGPADIDSMPPPEVGPADPEVAEPAPAEPAESAATDVPVPEPAEPSDDAAPTPAPPGAGTPAPTATGPQLPGANITIGEATVDGVTVKGLSCRTGGGGLGALLGTLTLTAGISKRRTELDRCAPSGKVETPIHWHQAGGKITKVTASGPDQPRNRCVERALLGAVAPQAAECMATVVHGK